LLESLGSHLATAAGWLEQLPFSSFFLLLIVEDMISTAKRGVHIERAPHVSV
jgi:hypothetical protein